MRLIHIRICDAYSLANRDSSNMSTRFYPRKWRWSLKSHAKFDRVVGNILTRRIIKDAGDDAFVLHALCAPLRALKGKATWFNANLVHVMYDLESPPPKLHNILTLSEPTRVTCNRDIRHNRPVYNPPPLLALKRRPIDGIAGEYRGHFADEEVPWFRFLFWLSASKSWSNIGTHFESNSSKRQ